jgi:hypothetical protein
MSGAIYRRALIGLLMLSISVSAAAQLPVVLQSEMGRKGSQRAFKNLDEFATCVVKRGNADVSIFLAADFPPKHMDSGGIFLANKYDSCLRGTFLMSIHPPYLRGALIEAEFHRLAAGSRDAHPIALGHVGATEVDLPPALAECLVRAQPEVAKRLLETRAGSPEQGAAFAAFDPAFTTCARAAGVNQTAPQLLRYQIAEAMYRKLTEGAAKSASQVVQ